MKIQLIGSYLNGVQVFQSGIFQDERGSFMETFRKDQFEKNGLSQEFIQDNHSKSFCISFARTSLPMGSSYGKAHACFYRKSLPRRCRSTKKIPLFRTLVC